MMQVWTEAYRSETIEEVGGYVLIAVNQVDSVPLSRLRLIRGNILYEGRFSLLVLTKCSSGVRDLQLSNLTEILRGGVKITHNPLLCHVTTIVWADILDQRTEPSKVELADNAVSCPACDVSCVNGSCWGPEPQSCQKFTRLLCADQCSRRCRGPTPADCCNEHCAAGCTGPHASDCLACQMFNDEGTCQRTCPHPMIIDNTGHPIPNPRAKFTFGPTCVKACPHNYVVMDWACVRSCPPGKYEVLEKGVHRCKDCDGPCPKGFRIGSSLLIIITLCESQTLSPRRQNEDSFKNDLRKVGAGLGFIIVKMNLRSDAIRHRKWIYASESLEYFDNFYILYIGSVKDEKLLQIESSASCSSGSLLKESFYQLCHEFHVCGRVQTPAPAPVVCLCCLCVSLCVFVYFVTVWGSDTCVLFVCLTCFSSCLTVCEVWGPIRDVSCSCRY
ncbi:hypothetical protein WMY93_034246, partial [Mugilogobius chulae]